MLRPIRVSSTRLFAMLDLRSGKLGRRSLMTLLSWSLGNSSGTRVRDSLGLFCPCGKVPADPAPVDPSSSIPQVVGILLKGYSFLQSFMEEEREYLHLFTRDVTALDSDIYHDSLRGAVLAYVRLQRGHEQVEELERLRGQVSRLTEEVSVVVKERVFFRDGLDEPSVPSWPFDLGRIRPSLAADSFSASVPT